MATVQQLSSVRLTVTYGTKPIGLHIIFRRPYLLHSMYTQHAITTAEPDILDFTAVQHENALWVLILKSRLSSPHINNDKSARWRHVYYRTVINDQTQLFVPQTQIYQHVSFCLLRGKSWSLNITHVNPNLYTPHIIFASVRLLACFPPKLADLFSQIIPALARRVPLNSGLAEVWCQTLRISRYCGCLQPHWLLPRTLALAYNGPRAKARVRSRLSPCEICRGKK
jgi:hypothetical protein